MNKKHLCYGHNVQLNKCPSVLNCVIRELLSRVGWALIRLSTWHKGK